MHRIYCLFFIGQALLAQTVINEYSAANFTNYTDNYGDFEDWFELYNTGNSSQNLGGYYLSDKSTNLTKYKIPNKMLSKPKKFTNSVLTIVRKCTFRKSRWVFINKYCRWKK